MTLLLVHGWVRLVNIKRGGKGTNKEIADKVRRDESTVSRDMTVQKGLPPAVLNNAGLSDDDLAEVLGKDLRALAKLPRKERRAVLQEVRAAKDQGADTKALARCVAKQVSTTKRGRPAKPYTLSERKDGRVRFTLNGSELDAQTAGDALADLGPVLRRLTTAAGVPSLDEFLGMARPSLAARTIRRISLVPNNMHVLVAAKMPALQALYSAAGLGRPGPVATK